MTQPDYTCYRDSDGKNHCVAPGDNDPDPDNNSTTATKRDTTTTTITTRDSAKFTTLTIA
ncbi:hypothetical protein FRC01_008343 [Tulasnella sp. 417]|nr:hypothetical protein FRC01_008343 [Tulasnella sp. 417]